MPPVPVRKLHEVVARYRYEPDLQDIWVEGSTDRPLVANALKHAGCDGVRIFTAEEVEVPSDEVAASGELQGARGKIVALARAIENGDGPPPRVSCVVESR